MLIFLVCLIAFLLFCSAFFSASETALFSLSSPTLKVYRNHPDPRKQLIASLLSRPRDLLVTIIMLNILVNILVQNAVATFVGDYSNWFINVGVPFALTLVIGEVVPKSVGLANSQKISHAVAPTISFLTRLFLPIRFLFIEITNFVSRCVFFFLKREEEISTDELLHALKESKEGGVLSHDEAELIYGYLRLQEASVKTIMRPREEVIIFDIEEPLSKLIHLFVDQECSRIPICEGDLDHVIGIMTSRLFFMHRHTLQRSRDLIPVLHKPAFVPETMPAPSLMNEMYEREESIALVVDEYGSVSGLIALEDLVEVVVGEIVDRRDEKDRYTRVEEGVIITSGKLELKEFEEIFGVELKSESDVVTVGGWLMEQLGEIPKPGHKHVTQDFLFHVLSADPNRIRRLYIRRVSPTKRRGGP